MTVSGAWSASHGSGAGADDVGAARASRRRAPVAVALVAALVGAGVRYWQVSGRGSLGWNDTADFQSAARASWWSLDLWAGQRSPGAAVVLKLVAGDLDAYVRVQAAIAVVCWALLAGSVATAVAGRRWARWAAAGVVVAFSVTTPVTMWDRSVLSESLAVSALALVAAAGLQLSLGVTAPRVAAVLAALAAWLATRDSIAVVALLGGATVLAGVAVTLWRARHGDRPDDDDGDGGDPPRPSGTAGVDASDLRRLVVLGAAAMVLGLAVMVGSAHGERHHFPMRNVFEVRVLPYPDRVAWFAERGMPQAEVFAGPGARAPHVEPGIPPVMYVGDDDSELGPWLEWVESDGRAAFARYVATHPQYLVTEPLRSPERAFNNALGDRGFYRPLDMPRVRLVDSVLALPTALVLLVGALVAGWAIGRRTWNPVLAAGAALAVLAVPHGLVAWHGDGMETARHLVVPALQLHLGVLLVAVGALAGGSRAPGASDQTSAKPRSRLGRSSPPSASTTAPVT